MYRNSLKTWSTSKNNTPSCCKRNWGSKVYRDLSFRVAVKLSDPYFPNWFFNSYCVSFIAGEINSHNSEMQDIERNIRSMQNDMTKLNTLITKESGLREALQQGTVLMESDFIQALKVSHSERVPKRIWYNRLNCDRTTSQCRISPLKVQILWCNSFVFYVTGSRRRINQHAESNWRAERGEGKTAQ